MQTAKVIISPLSFLPNPPLHVKVEAKVESEAEYAEMSRMFVRTITSSFDRAIAPLVTATPVQAGTTPPVAPATFLPTLARLIMKSGKLTRSHSHLELLLSSLALATSSPPMPILLKALEIVSPEIRIVGRRKGTKSLPTPQPLTEDQRLRQSWKWIVEASEKRQGTEKIFGKRLAAEVLAVVSGQSEAIKKKEARHAQGVIGRANVSR